MSDNAQKLSGSQAILQSLKRLRGASPVQKRNRRQKIVFVLLTLLIAGAGAAAFRYFLQAAELTFAVGPDGTLENNFARRLAKIAAQSKAFRIKVVVLESRAAALQQFASNKADLTIARTDTKITTRARAFAILDHSLLLIGVPKNAKPKSLANLRGKRLAIIGDDERDSALVRQILKAFDVPVSSTLETKSLEEWPHLFEAGGPAAVFYLAREYEIDGAKFWNNPNRKPDFDLAEVDGAKSIVQHMHGVTAETIDAGLIRPSPKIPDDDVESVAVDEILLGRARISNAVAADLAAFIIENKEQLAEPGVYATNIQPPDTDKDALILAHPGVDEYISDDTKSFVDRYSDLIYLAISLASVTGSIFLGLYSTVTRVSPVRAGQLTENVMELGAHAAEAHDFVAISDLESQLREILSEVLAGMRDGSVSHDGFDAFRMAFEVARGAIATQKDSLTVRPSGAPDAPRDQAASAAMPNGSAENAEATPVDARNV